MKRRVALHVVLPLVLGLMVYVVFRRSDLRLFQWMHSLHLDRCVAVTRVAFAPIRVHTPGWLAGSLPDAAWAYAFGASLALVWRGTSDRLGARAWWAIGAVVTATLEVGQAAHLIPGVFDTTDLAMMMIAFGLAVAHLRSRPRRLL